MTDEKGISGREKRKFSDHPCYFRKDLAELPPLSSPSYPIKRVKQIVP